MNPLNNKATRYDFMVNTAGFINESGNMILVRNLDEIIEAMKKNRIMYGDIDMMEYVKTQQHEHKNQKPNNPKAKAKSSNERHYVDHDRHYVDHDDIYHDDDTGDDDIEQSKIREVYEKEKKERKDRYEEYQNEWHSRIPKDSESESESDEETENSEDEDENSDEPVIVDPFKIEKIVINSRIKKNKPQEHDKKLKLTDIIREYNYVTKNESYKEFKHSTAGKRSEYTIDHRTDHIYLSIPTGTNIEGFITFKFGEGVNTWDKNSVHKINVKQLRLLKEGQSLISQTDLCQITIANDDDNSTIVINFDDRCKYCGKYGKEKCIYQETETYYTNLNFDQAYHDYINKYGVILGDVSTIVHPVLNTIMKQIEDELAQYVTSRLAGTTIFTVRDYVKKFKCENSRQVRLRNLDTSEFYKFISNDTKTLKRNVKDNLSSLYKEKGSVFLKLDKLTFTDDLSKKRNVELSKELLIKVRNKLYTDIREASTYDRVRQAMRDTLNINNWKTKYTDSMVFPIKQKAVTVTKKIRRMDHYYEGISPKDDKYVIKHMELSGTVGTPYHMEYPNPFKINTFKMGDLYYFSPSILKRRNYFTYTNKYIKGNRIDKFEQFYFT